MARVDAVPLVTDAVVCARGERARTFVPVIEALKAGAGGQVIFVDDGGNRGVRKARRAGARVVAGPRLGKSAAMATGLEYVRTPRVIFADADITGFTAEHARKLAAQHDGQLTGLRDNGSRILGPWPPISGERSLPTGTAVAALAQCRGYEAETALNAFAGAWGLPCETFVMEGCRNPRKSPGERAMQVIRAMARHFLGMLWYMASWCVTALTH